MQNYTPYELGRIISRSNGVNSMKEYQLRDIKHRITRDFRKSIDAEDVKINGEPKLVLITRDKGDEQIKRIKSLPDERFDLGDIVNWNGTNYIVYKVDADRRIQTKGRMYECNTTLRWKNRNGKIIERVGKGEDATKYGEGTEGTFRLRIGEFQLKVIVRLDSETVQIKRDDRFIIDADEMYYNYTYPNFGGDEVGNLNYSYDNEDNNVPYKVNDSGDLQSELNGLSVDENGNLNMATSGYALYGITPTVYRVSRRNVVTGTFPNIGYVELTLVEDQFVAGQDDVVNMIAPSVSQIVNSNIDNSNNNGNDGSDETNTGTNDDSEGSWL